MKYIDHKTPMLPSDNKMISNGTYAFLDGLRVMLETAKVDAPKPVFMPCTKLQCLYVLNFSTREVISSTGVEEMLGYTTDEFKLKSLDNMVHPEDIEVLNAIMCSVSEYIAINQTVNELTLSATYRLRKKNGNYVKVLRQTVIAYNQYDRQTIYHSNMLTDISFMKSGSQVEWTFEAPNFDHDRFKMYVPQSITQFFSARELEVLELIDKGLTSQAIAKVLFISKHTVDTHRRKMLQKTGCSNAIALLEFYRSHNL